MVSQNEMALQGSNPACAVTPNDVIKDVACAANIPATTDRLSNSERIVALSALSEGTSSSAPASSSVKDGDSQLPEVPDFSEDDFDSDKVYRWAYDQFKKTGSGFVEHTLVRKLSRLAKKFDITDFKSGYQAYKKDHEKSASIINIGNKTFFTGSSGNPELFCGPFEADDDGIRLKNQFGQADIVSFQPICPTSRIVDVETGMMQVRLWVRMNGVNKSFLLSPSQLLDSRKLIALSDYGIDVSQATAPHLSSYLRYVIMDPRNAEMLPEEKGISHCGYIMGNSTEFAPFTGNYTCTGKDGELDVFECLKNPIGKSKRQFELFEHVRKCKQFSPIVRIAIAASFASVLLRPLNHMGFFVHLCGKENTAKSAAVWLAASIWADPKKTAPYVRSFDGTINGTEGFAHFLQSLPVCLDETTTNRDQVKFDTFVYKMLQGMDKTRGTKDGSFRKHKSWACTFLSTGENPIQNENSNGGSMVRVLSLSTGSKPLFGDYAPTIYREVSQHAGWIGRKFVERVLCPEHLEEADDLLKQFIAEFKALGYEGKQADAAAVCLAADTLASQYVFEDSDDSLRLKVDDFLPYIITPAESDVGMRTAQWLKEFVFVNKERFIDMAGFRPIGECWGKFMPGGYVAIIRSVLSKQMEKAGLATGAKRFAEWADENGLLQRSKSDSSYFKSVDFKGSTQRSLVINIDAIDPVPEDELPFPDEADEAEQKSEDAPQTALPEFQSDDIVQLSA